MSAVAVHDPHWRAAAVPFACTARVAIFGDQDSSEVEQQIDSAWRGFDSLSWNHVKSGSCDADASTAGRESRTEAPRQRKAAARTALSASTLDARLARPELDRRGTCVL